MCFSSASAQSLKNYSGLKLYVPHNDATGTWGWNDRQQWWYCCVKCTGRVKSERFTGQQLKKRQQGQSRTPDAGSATMSIVIIYSLSILFLAICASHSIGERLGVGEAEGNPGLLFDGRWILGVLKRGGTQEYMIRGEGREERYDGLGCFLLRETLLEKENLMMQNKCKHVILKSNSTKRFKKGRDRVVIRSNI